MYAVLAASCFASASSTIAFCSSYLCSKPASSFSVSLGGTRNARIASIVGLVAGPWSVMYLIL